MPNPRLVRLVSNPPSPTLVATQSITSRSQPTSLAFRTPIRYNEDLQIAHIAFKLVDVKPRKTHCSM